MRGHNEPVKGVNPKESLFDGCPLMNRAPDENILVFDCPQEKVRNTRIY